MSSFKLIYCVVPHDKGEKLTRAAMESGCRGGTVMMGRGLASSNLSAVLGLGESTKDVLMMIVDEEVKEAVKEAVIRSTCREKRKFGEFFTTDVDSVMKTGNITEGTDMQGSDAKMEMINVIVNKGYADDVMAAARSAGAGGGTVVNARGTARENDERFFGVHIVPEKEMLIMVVPSDKKEAVLKKIQELRCLKEPGMGIAFSSPVDDFALLGKK